MTDLVTTFYVGSVPGSDLDANVDLKDLSEKYLAAVVAGMGTGATIHQARGAWKAGSALVLENSFVIESIATIKDEEREVYRKMALETARELCRIGRQQEVYVTQRERELLVATP